MMASNRYHGVEKMYCQLFHPPSLVLERRLLPLNNVIVEKLDINTLKNIKDEEDSVQSLGVHATGGNVIDDSVKREYSGDKVIKHEQTERSFYQMSEIFGERKENVDLDNYNGGDGGEDGGGLGDGLGAADAADFDDAVDVNIKTNIMIKSHQCATCNYEFRNRSDLTKHIRVHTGEVNEVKSDEVNEVKSDLHDLQDYDINIVHVTTNGSVRYQCKICLNDYKSKEHARHHVWLHLERTHNCDICGKIFTKTNGLTKHMRREHDEKCKKCNRAFVVASALRTHITSCYGDRNSASDDVHKLHKCTMCDKKYTAAWSLKKHMRGVHGYKNTCKKCGRVDTLCFVTGIC